MKKLFYLVLAAVLFAVGCSESFDDSKIWDKLNDHESRIAKLEELCKQMNTNISSLQTLVNALNQKEFITNVAPISKNGEEIGYTITFTSGKTITIYHGQDGADGKDGINGENGADGKDGSTPIIGVKKASDNIYYWTLNGEWLLDDDGNKIKAVGTDGKDGQNGADGADGKDGQDGATGPQGPQGPQGPAGENGTDGKDGQNGADGKDGITPQLKIEEGYWYISYDNGSSWKQLGKATGENGKDGQDGKDGEDGADGENGKDGADGDSFFQGVDLSNEDYIIFTLADGTQFKIPTWAAYEKLQTLCNQLNTNIASLQTIIDAMQNNDFVKSITPIMENGKEIGYTITFTKRGTITIYHGKDGQNGQDGAVGPQGPQGPQGPAGESGESGESGSVPVIGVKKASDGIYYWTLNGEWLLDDDGNKIKAVGTDGKDGQNGADGEDGQNGADGKDGITPQLKIEVGYWYISYDNGSSWKQLGKATGENGKDGEDGKDGADGDSFFQSVTQDDEYVYFTLADGTQITLAKEQALEITFNTEECFVNGGESYEVTYTITGADADTKVAAMAQDNYTVKVVLTDYKSGKIVVTAPSADITESQVLVFVSKGTQTIMRVLYFAEKVTLTVSTDNVALEYDDTTFEVKVTTNLDYTVHIPEEASSWLSVASTRAMREETLLFAVEENTTAERRSTIVELRRNGKAVQSIAVSQGVNPEYLPAGYKIFYTSTNGKVVAPKTPSALGAAIISNTYANGVGVIVFDRNITTIGKYAFEGCSSLTTIAIPDSVTEIGWRAFDGCKSLTSITIPDSVTTIEYGAFWNCSSLTSITIPDSVTTIGDYAFDGCKSLTSVTIGDSVTTIGDYAFSYCSSLTSITIGDSVTEIGWGAFSGCSSLTSVNIKISNLAKYCAESPIIIKFDGISRHLFIGEIEITKLSIPDGVTTIGEDAFRNCSSLATITIPDSVTTIGERAFQYCSGLTTITIPDSVTEIGGGAFDGCSNLTSVTIGDSVTTIGGGAFSGCYNLTSVTIPDSVTTIGGSAFSGCSSLTKAVIGSGVKSIGYSAFENCYFLNEIICKPTTPPTASLNSSGKWDAFKAIGTSAKIYVPTGSGDAYKTASYWSNYASIIVEKAM